MANVLPIPRKPAKRTPRPKLVHQFLVVLSATNPLVWLFVLQGLPGVGPALASRLLDFFGSIERVVSADVSALAEVRGIGPGKAALIWELVR